MLWTFSFKEYLQSHYSLEIDKDGNIPEQRFSGVEFEIFPTEYHTWSCPIFVLEYLLQGGLTGIPKWEPRAINGVYLGHSPSHTGSVYLVLNTRTGHVSPHYHVVFYDTLSTVEHMWKGTVPVNWKKMVKEHSYLATQENFTLTK